MRSTLTQPLPLSIQSFSTLIEENRVYVDKTGILHHLITSGSRACFLSRPRRFGKSLTVTTLEAIFQGKRELFKGLAISETAYDWQVYPVVRLDMKLATEPTVEQCELGARDMLKKIAAKYEIEYDVTSDNPIATLFNDLIQKLHEKTNQKVVVLIDEYDKPLINQLESHNVENAKEVQKFLKSFYGVLKSADAHIRFVFITGVSKFTKVSIFSDLNHLDDLSMDERYATMCGYTQTELETQFKPWINALAKKEEISQKEILEKIRKWYNGYRLTRADEYVYNPWSTIYLFEKQSFDTYWFETGTPTFLTTLMKAREFDMSSVNEEVSTGQFSTYNIEKLELIPLLFQTGYLTIKEHNPRRETYRLDFPNYEVARSFSILLLQTLCEISNETPIRMALLDALEADDIEAFFDVINTVYANIPSHLHEKTEAYYHSIFIAACQMAGVPVEVEQSSSLGRSDAVLKSPTKLYIVEFKLNGSAEDAIDQIHKKKYLDKYRYIGIPVIPVGVGFDYTQRQIVEVKIELS